MELLTNTVLVGAGATAVMDLWVLGRRHLLGVPVPSYGHVGRWLGHMRRGCFRHRAIAQAAPIRHEAALGWTVHYLVGIAFAALLPLLWGTAWFRQPAVGPALTVGLGTVLAPFLLMQPGMGAGFFARRTPRPAMARLHSLATHASFGLGLYLAAWVLRAFCPT